MPHPSTGAAGGCVAHQYCRREQRRGPCSPHSECFKTGAACARSTPPVTVERGVWWARPGLPRASLFGECIRASSGDRASEFSRLTNRELARRVGIRRRSRSSARGSGSLPELYGAVPEQQSGVPPRENDHTHRAGRREEVLRDEGHQDRDRERAGRGRVGERVLRRDGGRAGTSGDREARALELGNELARRWIERDL